MIDRQTECVPGHLYIFPRFSPFLSISTRGFLFIFFPKAILALEHARGHFLDSALARSEFRASNVAPGTDGGPLGNATTVIVTKGRSPVIQSIILAHVSVHLERLPS